MPNQQPPQYEVVNKIMGSRANEIINVDTIAELINFIDSQPMMFCEENSGYYGWKNNAPDRIGATVSQYFNADDPPTNPNAFNDEFNDPMLNVAWTKKNNNSQHSDIVSTISNSVFSLSENLPPYPFSVEPQSYIYKPIAGDFDIVSKIAVDAPVNSCGGGLCLLQNNVVDPCVWFHFRPTGANSDAVYLEVQVKSGELEYYSGKSARGTNSSINSISRNISVLDDAETFFRYLRVRRIGTTLDFFTSKSGYIWKYFGSRTESTLGFTIAKIGIFAEGKSENPTTVFCDWIRNLI